MDEEKVIIYCVIPYFIFNTVFSIYINKTLIVNIFTPQYIFWYLLCLAIWRSSICYLKDINGIFRISILLGLYIGIIPEADRFMSISRMISFLPFFLMGYFYNSKEVMRIRKIPKICTIMLVILLSSCVILLHIRKWVPVKAYEEIQCYQSSGMSNIQGILVRIFSYLVGVLAIMCLINLVSDKEHRYSKYGSRTVVVYIFSAFSVKIMYKIILKMLGMTVLQHIGVGVLLGMCVTLITIIILSNTIFYDLYMKVMGGIGAIIIKKNKYQDGKIG